MTIVDINQINASTNRRPINPDKVKDLAASIRANGLINPITIDRNYNLIAGLHRLTAYRLLGYKQIECRIGDYEDSDRARLAEIDENFIRNELTPIERGELSEERDRILKTLGMRAETGDNQYRQKGGETISPPIRNNAELARESGVTERTYQQNKQIARDTHSDVKKLIKESPIAKSTTALLQIARTGKNERLQAEQAELAAKEAQEQQKLAEAERQKKLAEQLRDRQKQLQLAVFESIIAEKEAKQAVKETNARKGKQLLTENSSDRVGVQVGEEWLLQRHAVYCGDTTSKEFREKLPSRPVLAIVPPAVAWYYDYLVDDVNVVAVMRTEGHIHDFCHRSRMPVRFEYIMGDIYLAICSHTALLKPKHPIDVEGIEGLVSYLINLYTKPGNFVVSPAIGHGELLIACERLGRICFIGDENPKRVNQAICRWQQFAGKQAEKM